MTKKNLTNKKVPLRKCVACREQKEKSELLRIVKTNTGEFLLDLTYKANGRGAYVCKNRECFERAKKNGSFQRAFKGKVDQSLFELIEEVLESV